MNKKIKVSSTYGHSPKLYLKPDIYNEPKYKLIQWGKERSIIVCYDEGEDKPIIINNDMLMKLNDLGQVI